MIATDSPRTDLAPRSGFVVLLTVVSGYVDAVGFVVLGGAFTSVMTGNLVLTGIGAARGELPILITSVAAIVCYLVGCMTGARIPAPRDGAGSAENGAYRRVLTVEAGVLLLSAVLWWIAYAPGGPARLPLLLLNAVALGLQSAAILRLGVPGLSTTYLTGTLTSLAAAVATRRPWAHWRRPLVQVVGLAAGGALGTVLVLHVPVVVPALPPAAVAFAVLAASTGTSRYRGRGRPRS